MLGLIKARPSLTLLPGPPLPQVTMEMCDVSIGITSTQTM